MKKAKQEEECQNLPECDVPVVTLDAKDKREVKLHLPELSEGELSRHYTELAKKSHGVNDGFYPLGSCTMKYNPRVNEDSGRIWKDLQIFIRYSRQRLCRDVWKY